jgi:NACalpha-BTF3-like transcription factor
MDLARLSHLPTEQLPELIQLEREIDNEIIEDENEDDMISFPPPLRVKPPLPPKPAGLMLRSAAAVEPEPEPVNIDPEPSTRLSLMSVAEITEEDLELLGEDQSVDLDCFDVPEPVLVKKATQMQRRLSMDVIMVPNVVTVPSPVENTALLVETTKVLSMFSSQCDMSTSMSGQGSDHPPISNNNTSNETTTMDDVLALMPDVGVDNNDTPAQETWHPSPEPTITTPEKKPTKVVFVKGDEIDEAVQIMSNQYGGKIKLKRVRKGKYQVRL